MAIVAKVDHRQWSCTRKKRYGTSLEAERAKLRVWAHEFMTNGAEYIGEHRPIHVYKCPYCKGWHVGHKPKEIQ